MSRYFTPELAALEPYTPGEQPQNRQYIKLNTNENPYPPAPGVAAAVAEAAQKLALYSDPESGALTKAAAEALPGVTTGVHFHNDTGTAVASSIAGVRAGATHIQGTFLGFGERCGNANLSTIIADLVLKGDCECGVDLTALTRTAHAVAEISNVKLDPAMPYVGAAAFAH